MLLPVRLLHSSEFPECTDRHEFQICLCSSCFLLIVEFSRKKMKNPGITFSRHAGTNVIVVPPDFYSQCHLPSCLLFALRNLSVKQKADTPHRNICHQSVSYPGTENGNSCFRYPYPLTLEHGLSYLQSVRLASHKPIPKEASYCLPPTGSSL